MKLVFESKYASFGLWLGQCRDDEQEFERVSNTGGDFDPAPIPEDDESEVDDFFGFARG